MYNALPRHLDAFAYDILKPPQTCGWIDHGWDFAIQRLEDIESAWREVWRPWLTMYAVDANAYTSWGMPRTPASSSSGALKNHLDGAGTRPGWRCFSIKASSPVSVIQAWPPSLMRMLFYETVLFNIPYVCKTGTLVTDRTQVAMSHSFSMQVRQTLCNILYLLKPFRQQLGKRTVIDGKCLPRLTGPRKDWGAKSCEYPRSRRWGLSLQGQASP